jgi:hypothetical protein
MPMEIDNVAPSSGMALVHRLVNASGCSRIFLDGGSNMNESVASFLKGAMYRCAIASPSRLYGQAWKNATAQQRRRWMAPLAEPHRWCIRSFDAAPSRAAVLQASLPAGLAARVHFIDAALGVRTSASATRNIVRYSEHPLGETATTFSHHDIHRATLPQLSTYRHDGPSLDVRDIIERYASGPQGVETTLALKLDVEGGEFEILDALADSPRLLCRISYLFVEYHSLKANMSANGLAANAYNRIGEKIHRAMDEVEGCRLRINWRSFWSSCGESMRFAWMKSEQATGRRHRDATESGMMHAGTVPAPAAARRGRSRPRRGRKERKVRRA